jgi:AAA+ ATPase superfamily predicted ATPase
VTRLPAAERDELFALYRQLRLALIRVKGNAGLLGFYLRSLSETLQKVLEELFPHRKGRIYSRSGKAREAEDDSLVVYRHV